MANKDIKKSPRFNRIEHTIPVKPMSVNKAYLGRKRKSGEYRQYGRVVLSTLPCGTIPDRGNFQIHFTFGFSNSLSDVDNPVKPFLDLLQKKYSFNDNRVYRITVDKKLVKKGEEFIHFVIKKFKGHFDLRK